MSPGNGAVAVRRAAGLFQHHDRAVIEVRGSDRARWLDGMVSNDVASLTAGPSSSGCYALLLTPQGRIVADLHVLLRPDAFWLEIPAAMAAAVVERLDRFIVADDVKLELLPAQARLGLEGPAAPQVLATASGAPCELADGACQEAVVAGVEVLVAAFGWTGEPAFQLFGAQESAEGLADAIRSAGAPLGLVEPGAETLEILRIEAGIPRLGHELDEDVLPAEARLEHAVSFTKGCYTGQEIVARIESRGRVKHQLVGLRFEGGSAPPAGEVVFAGTKSIGEITSACESPSLGSIALAFVRRPHDELGTQLSVAGNRASVCPLPFVATPA